jgi:DNA replication and repair protein RecF
LLDQISSRSFRNLDNPHWQPGPGCHLILGPNGAGKTSLLEAVYLLATTRSFRTAQLSDCAHHGGTKFHLQGEIDGDQRVHLEVGLGPEGRYRTLNGSVASLIDHLRALPVVSWTGEDREILSGGPEKRRRLLDQGIVGTRPTALESLARFRRTLFQKRQLLSRDDRGLRPWNELMASAAADLMRLRRQYVTSLSTALSEVSSTTDLELPDLRLEYRPSIRVENDDEEEILQELQKVSAEERREGRPLLGPQRDEVAINWGEHRLRTVGSAGERKVLGLLLTAARGRVLSTSERSPIYLLDDADSELDEKRLAGAWQAFEGSEQVLISSSRPGIWSMIPEAVRWQLTAGRIGLEKGSGKES